jgi:hypothetical protein
MFSPYKIPNSLENFCKISSNEALANELKQLLSLEETQQLWDIDTNRQKMAKELEHTKMISLRIPLPPKHSNITKTSQWNKVLVSHDTNVLKQYVLFQSLCNWIKESLLATGASRIDVGRIFFSNHKANTKIGLHTDQGEYFNYYDRFHFVIDQVDNENVFYIKEEPILLLTGNLYWVNNHVPHWLENKSNKDRINCIVDARLS